MRTVEETPWPPDRADDFFRSEAFGWLMMELLQLLAQRYPHIDFTDAVATVFVWFDQAGTRDPGFLRSGRFPTTGSLRAYVRQALWNAARAAERSRRAHEQITALPDVLVSPEISPVWLAAFHECRDRLPEPMQSVFDMMQEENDPPGGLTRDAWAAALLKLSPEQFERHYEEACHRIRQCMGAGGASS